MACVRIRDARHDEAGALEQLQCRASNVWCEYRAALAAHPEVFELPATYVADGRVRVAECVASQRLGFSVLLPGEGAAYELDGLFVEPDRMHRGIGRALVEDACQRAHAAGASLVEVVAGPAQGFYEKVGFRMVAAAETQFGPAVRMRRRLGDCRPW